MAGTTFDRHLPKEEAIAYQRVAEVISDKELRSLSISRVKLIKTDDALSKALSFLMGAPADGIVQVSFTDTTPSGIFIKEMLIMRSAINSA